MTDHELIRWLMAHTILAIWNPEIWFQHPNERKKRSLEIMYRTRGIVMHDRALNGETV